MHAETPNRIANYTRPLGRGQRRKNFCRNSRAWWCKACFVDQNMKTRYSNWGRHEGHQKKLLVLKRSSRTRGKQWPSTARQIRGVVHDGNRGQRPCAKVCGIHRAAYIGNTYFLMSQLQHFLPSKALGSNKKIPGTKTRHCISNCTCG